MYLRTVIDAEKLNRDIVEYLTITGSSFKNFSPDLIRIGYFYTIGRKIDTNNFQDFDDDIIIRVYYQKESFDCYVKIGSLNSGNVPFGDFMYSFVYMMRTVELKEQNYGT